MELRRIEQTEQAAERIVARNAMAEAEELAQERLLGLAEQLHVTAALGATQHSRESDDQDLEQVVPRIVVRSCPVE